jgi:hypothetical protein
LELDTQTIATLAGGAAGGMCLGWLARFAFTTYLARNDQKHDRWDDRINRIVVALVKLETTVSQLMEFRSDVKNHEARIAVVESNQEQQRKDLNGLGSKLDRTIKTIGH